jgi:multidrug efflux pump
MVLSAVFIPMAFFGGSTGVIYRQFSITIVSSMVLSVVVALILTPALCATLLKPVAKGHDAAEGGRFSRFFAWFNRVFDGGSREYHSIVGRLLAKSGRVIVVYALVLAVMGFLFWRLPTAFLPDEDQGILMCMIQLPAGATKARTEAVLRQVERHFLEDQKEAVDSLMTVSGFSFGGRGQNMGLAFVKLRDWDLRTRPDLRAKAVAGKAMGAFSKIRDAMVFAFPPPAVMELGNATGFDFQLQDRGGLGHDRLMAARNQLLGMAAQEPKLMKVRPNGQEDTPEYRLEIDKARVGSMGLSLADVNNAISTSWGSAYIGDFIDKGRVKKVYLQADAPFRMKPEDLEKWFVRNRDGAMVPFSAFATTRWSYGSPRLERYNGLPSAEILGEPAPGTSSGEAMKIMEELAAKLPAGIGFEWTGLSFEERLTGSQAPALYAISLLVVFLSLAALYESWAVPASVMLVVPLGVVGALVAATVRGLSNDVYFQVGLLTTIGLSAKNAILIVEFAEEQLAHGKGLVEAALEATRLRLRPILMTSLAFILGVLPMVVTKGAGSGAQNAIGTGVMGGMISATFLAILFVPVFFLVVRRAFPLRREADAPAAEPAGELVQHTESR